jgi:hypothetical protein
MGAGPPESWVGSSGEQATFNPRTGELLRTDHPALTGRLRWPGLGTLGMCLGDVLADPLPADPGAFRALVWGTEAHWHLTLSGTNRCSLGGVLVLDVLDDGVDPSGLEVEGLPWSQGGRQRARVILAAGLRADAERVWGELDVPARIRLLDLLSRDPEPEAAAVLHRLLDLAGPMRVDVEGAISRRAPIGPHAPSEH